MPDRSWTLLSSRQIADYPVLRLREDRYRFEPSGQEGNFVVCESRDWALVIPITLDKQIVLVRQYRHGVRQVVLEVPGGILDPGETPEASAARELREETGYEAASIRLVGKMMPNPAINSAHVHVLVAEGCRKVGQPQLDPFERIDVVLRPCADIPGMIYAGEMSHGLVIAALALAGMN
jgi:8-oxo-dGTP pyrophosphatase MutT (NUDIX family)